MRVEDLPSWDQTPSVEKLKKKIGYGENFAETLRAKIENARHQPSTENNNAFELQVGRKNERQIVSLGKITNNTPTVSALLIKHPEYGSEYWKIIHSEKNSSKPFTRILPGSEIYLDQETKELFWGKEIETSVPQLRTSQSANSNPMEGINLHVEKDENLKGSNLALPVTLEMADDEKIFLGTIQSEAPTVSHLLTGHPDYSDKAWDIIHSSVNRGKPFSQILPETKIFIDPVSKELTWHHPSMTRQDIVGPETALPMDRHRTSTELGRADYPTIEQFDMAEAVTPYLGKKYSEIDCYGLIVRGLDAMGIPYKGKGGIMSRLLKMAADNGLPSNAFLNGEGIVKAAGSEVFSRSFPSVGKNWRDMARDVFEEIQPHLEKGMILSFSTRTKGHTGVVSQQAGMWTYINSGRLDNQVEPAPVKKGVGEEILHAEIDNWFQLAANRRESLTISMGKLQRARVKTALGQTGADSVGTI